MRVTLFLIEVCICLISGSVVFAADGLPRPLRFVSDEAYPPISHIHVDHPEGLGVDLARAVAEQLGRSLEIDLLPWTDAQARVSQGQADFLGPMTITPQRRETYDFTAPFYQFEYVFLVRRDARGLRAIADLSGQRVGVTVGGYPRQRLQREAGLNLVMVKDTEDAVNRLRDKVIDAYAVDKWVATYELGVLGVHDVVVAGPPFEVRESALAVQKGNAALLQDLDMAMAALRQSGAYQKIVDRWQGRIITVLSDEEQKAHEQRLRLIGALAVLSLIVAVAWILFQRRQIALRQAAAQALKTSEERLRLALQATNDVIWDWDVAADAQTWNAAGSEIFGWQDIVARPQSAAWWVERVHPEDRDRVAASFHAVVDDPSQHVWRDEYRFRRSDGRYAEVLDRGQVLRDAQGKAVRMVGAMQDITRQKRISAELRASQQLLQSALDSLPSHIAILDDQGTILSVNLRWSDFARLGLWSHPNHGIGENYLAACDRAAASGDTDAGRIAVTLRDLLAGRIDRFDHEYNCPDPTGSERWFRMTVNAFMDQTQGMRALVRHSEFTVDRQREAEQRRLVRAVEASDSIILITDRNGCIVYTNPAFTRYTGYTREEALGRNPRFMHRAGETITDFAGLWQTLKNGEVWTGSFCNRSKSGEVLWEDATLSPIKNELGEIEHIVAVKENVNEKRALLQELETHKTHLERLVAQRTGEVLASEARLRLILESTADSLIGTDVDGNISFINPAACTMLGYRAEELIGRNVHAAIHYHHADGSSAREMDCAVSNAIRTGQELHVENDAFWHKAGHAIPVSLAMHPIRRDHHVVGGVMSFRDISARQQLDAEREAARLAAEKLAQIKSEFLANMSHEIRTPLNGVLGLAQIGYRNSLGLGSTQDTFARILNSGRLLLTIINDILDFSKIEAGKLEIESVPFDPADLVDEVIATTKVAAAAKDITLIRASAPDLPRACLGDSVRVSQILLNLLTNAVKFTKVGEIRLAAGRKDNWLVFEVIDSGIGIPEEQIDRLFQPFEQADSTTTRQFGGTGLGLAISRRLADLMGGTLTAASLVGQGSTFTLRLPLKETDQPVQRGMRTSSSSENRLSGLRILVADDNGVNQLVLEDFLTREGATTKVVGNGEQVVDAIARGEIFDVILMDVQMPVMDGLEATRRIGQIAPDLPVIGQTAHALKEEHDKCLAAGMRATITKPIDIDLLAATVLAHVKTPDNRSTVAGTRGDEQSVPENQAVDWAGLAADHSRHPAFINRLVELALLTHAQDADRLRNLIGAASTPEIGKLAHTLKGLAGNLHALELGNAAIRVMHGVRSESPDVPEQARELAVALEMVIEELRQRKPA